MRKFGSFLICGAFLFGGVALVEGQPAAQPKGGFGGFGGGAGRQSALTLLNNEQIKKELNITEEQLDKLPAEVLNAIAKVLNDKQFKRLKQIELQQRGNNAFKDEKVQKALGISSEQVKSIESILADSAKETAELFKGGAKGGFGKGGFGGNTEKLDKIRTEAKEKIYGVLSKEQRKTWREMVGDEFKMERPQFGGFGNKKGTDPKKAEPKKTDI